MHRYADSFHIIMTCNVTWHDPSNLTQLDERNSLEGFIKITYELYFLIQIFLFKNITTLFYNKYKINYKLFDSKMIEF